MLAWLRNMLHENLMVQASKLLTFINMRVQWFVIEVINIHYRCKRSKENITEKGDCRERQFETI